MRTSRVSVSILIATSAVLLLVSCSKNQYDMPGHFQRGVMHAAATEPCEEYCLVNPLEEITAEEEALLLSLLVQEEMAWSVYEAMDFPMPLFDNISGGELVHMEKVACILDHYQIEYTMIEEPGLFTDQDLVDLYNDLVARVVNAEEPLIEAWTVGAELEAQLICDLQVVLGLTANEAISTVMESLICASSNHLRTFVTHLTGKEAPFDNTACLSPEDIQAIVDGGHQQCGD